MAELENCDLNDELENTHENFEFETRELYYYYVDGACVTEPGWKLARSCMF